MERKQIQMSQACPAHRPLWSGRAGEFAICSVPIARARPGEQEATCRSKGRVEHGYIPCTILVSSCHPCNLPCAKSISSPFFFPIFHSVSIRHQPGNQRNKQRACFFHCTEEIVSQGLSRYHLQENFDKALCSLAEGPVQAWGPGG